MPCKSHPPPAANRTAVSVQDEVRRWEFTWQYGVMKAKLRSLVWGWGGSGWHIGQVGDGLLDRIRSINRDISKVIARGSTTAFDMRPLYYIATVGTPIPQEEQTTVPHIPILFNDFQDEADTLSLFTR
ncbi:hypothetical protein TWF569_001109 [Orbilia oligospora]|uniref:Uncharacterized protein n=1 Tax=Orbilia oligospora TaxID=2813651 RepID=A0A7C8P8I8_ORBOL|nr:hypothetical protein TWF706_003159 [Orbilia oligospora]KAF3118787.1 hypothetical protein TWF594_005952 [Orbilia oligospora]KAF3124963.1 hypothetical protein TWF569_001109 [Orbilia oligospora]KAF3139463.1 hypothetical protein TWF703_003652 [Orbilia oligospora]